MGAGIFISLDGLSKLRGVIRLGEDNRHFAG
jgi:hypothetical protein